VPLLVTPTLTPAGPKSMDIWSMCGSGTPPLMVWVAPAGMPFWNRLTMSNTETATAPAKRTPNLEVERAIPAPLGSRRASPSQGHPANPLTQFPGWKGRGSQRLVAFSRPYRAC
jgi:hypothetical protein